MNKKIGFVAPWYGEDIQGGAEAELRGLVHHLQDAGTKLEVLTTCIRSWDSDWNVPFHQPGLTVEKEIRVRRFPARRRFPNHGHRVVVSMNSGVRLCDAEEKIYCEELVHSPELMAYIRGHQEEYSLFVFIPFTRGTTYAGCQINPEKSILIPCLHDEPCADLDCFRRAYGQVKGMIFHSASEKRLAKRLYGVDGPGFEELGEGVDTDWQGDAARFRATYGIQDPFILYAGRKDHGKKVDLLVDFFARYKDRHPGRLKLILIGGGALEIPPREDILDLGFVSRQDKYDAYAAASLFCNPSVAESFSLVIMESWLMSRPVLVNGACEVTREFAEECSGGLWFSGFETFEKCVDRLISDEKLAREMGERGKKFVESHFSWPSIVTKYQDYFERMACDP